MILRTLTTYVYYNYLLLFNADIVARRQLLYINIASHEVSFTAWLQIIYKDSNIYSVHTHTIWLSNLITLALLHYFQQASRPV